MDIEVNSFIVTTLERINDKLDKHEEKIDGLAEALRKLIAVDIELRELKNSQERIWIEIREIQKMAKESGCQAFIEFRREHDNELKHNIDKIKACVEFKDKVENKINELEMKPAKKWENATMTFITASAASLAGYFMAKVGLK